ncbi:MAG: hypothetical protein P4L31_03955 [Candidatus Babeliales bacterium]|nr:hypothetical protein [Candidatus Babeliales bacterium]
MIQKKITRTIALSLIMLWSFTAFYIPTIIAAPQQPMAMGDQMLTPEDLQAMERAVEEERAKMSPEERAAFDNDVEQLTKELEAMKPEELEAFMNQVLFGQPEQAPQEEPVVVTPPTPVQAPKVVEPAKPQKPLKKQDEALARIDGIINRTTSFLNKIARYIEFTGKLRKWSEQGKITGWKPDYTWDSIKKQIEDLLNKLTIIKDKDPKTNDYKYLNDLIDDESLYNNLGKFKDSLSKLEPDIEIDDFGIEPVSRQVRYVIRKVLAEYIEALTVLNINSDLDKLIAKYEPTAKKHREEEEGITKKSLEESKIKQQRKVKPAIVAGKGDQGDSYSGGYSSGSNPYDYYPYSGGYSPSSYGSYDTPSNAGGYKPPTPPSASSGSSGSSGGGSGSRGDSGSKDGKDKDGKTREDKDEKDGKYEPRKSSDGKSKDKGNRTDRAIDSFENGLELAIDAVEDKEMKFDTLPEIIKGSDKDQDEKLLRAITEANEQLGSALNGLKILKKQKLSNDQRTQIQSIYNKHKKSLDEIVKSIDKIDTIKAEFPDLRKIKFDIGDKAPEPKPEEEKVKREVEGIEELEDEEAPVQTVPVKRAEHSPYLLKENIANIKKAYDALFPKTK